MNINVTYTDGLLFVDNEVPPEAPAIELWELVESVHNNDSGSYYLMCDPEALIYLLDDVDYITDVIPLSQHKTTVIVRNMLSDLVIH